MTKTKWLDRRISYPGPHLCLCRTEAEYRAAIEPFGMLSDNTFPDNGRPHATTRFLRNDKQNLVALVCLGDAEGLEPLEIVGLLVHEAVHICQQYFTDIGEHTPGTEQEAYAVQAIAQELLGAYRDSLQE